MTLRVTYRYGPVPDAGTEKGLRRAEGMQPSPVCVHGPLGTPLYKGVQGLDGVKTNAQQHALQPWRPTPDPITATSTLRSDPFRPHRPIRSCSSQLQPH